MIALTTDGQELDIGVGADLGDLVFECVELDADDLGAAGFATWLHDQVFPRLAKEPVVWH